MILKERLRRYREDTFYLLSGKRVKTSDEAVAFVQERGFVFFWPITGIKFPSLWMAAAGDRPVADEHDDPGHVTWGWKDALLGGRDWYYAKVIRKKSTMIAFDIAPYFYALSENYGSPEDDYIILYEQGRLTQEAKTVYEALLDNGPLDTVQLRKATRMTSPASESRFNRAISDLQADFKIIPIAVTKSGAWHYAFAYDIVARHYPDLPENAQKITENLARSKLLELYFLSLGAARPEEVIKFFGWKRNIVERTIEPLVQLGLLMRDQEMEQQTGEWVALAKQFS